MNSTTGILIKITGNALKSPHTGELSPDLIISLARQCAIIAQNNVLGIVIGGGNFFRGSQQGVALGLESSTAHHIGMLATVMNGLIVQDIFEREGVRTTLFSALTIPSVGLPLTTETIDTAVREQKVLIFVGGTGMPYCTTDTAALIQGLRIGATVIWKATNVDGVYDKDPARYKDAQLLKLLTYEQAISLNIGIMDRTAIVMAQQYQIPVRIFNVFTENALLRAYQDTQFGSTMKATMANTGD